MMSFCFIKQGVIDGLVSVWTRVCECTYCLKINTSTPVSLPFTLVLTLNPLTFNRSYSRSLVSRSFLFPVLTSSLLRQQTFNSGTFNLYDQWWLMCVCVCVRVCVCVCEGNWINLPRKAVLDLSLFIGVDYRAVLVLVSFL